MKLNYNITEAELPIMKVLWAHDELTSPDIFKHLDGNTSTLKTLLRRLVDKGAIKATAVNSRTYTYSAQVAQDDFINHERKGFINRLFNGSKEKMLLNFVKEEKITADDLKALLKKIEEME